MNAKEINDKLLENIDDFCKEFYPEGKRKGTELHSKNIYGGEGNSFCISLSSRKKGYWMEGAGGDQKGRTLYGLLCERFGKDARRVAMDFLGIKEADYGRIKRKVEKEYTPPKKDKCGKLKEQSPVMRYLTETRKISMEAIQMSRVSETKKPVVYPSKNGQVVFDHNIVFPFFAKDDELVKIKYMALERDERGKKYINSESGGAPKLFLMNLATPSLERLIVTEGELDALSMLTYGFRNTVSVPNGTGDDGWIEECYDFLSEFAELYFMFDMDDAGEECFKKIVDRLGRDRCYRVKLPHKDVNECLVSGVSKEAIGKAIADAQTYDPESISPLVNFEEEIVAIFEGKDKSIQGWDIPWNLPWKVRPAEWTLVSGVEGCGKTQGMLQMATCLTAQGKNGMICSMEMSEKVIGMILTQQALAMHNPHPSMVRAVVKEMFANTLLFTQFGDVKSTTLLDCISYARKKFAIDWFLIDNMMMLGDIGVKDLDAQNGLVKRINGLCSDTGMHGFFVVHQRKGQRFQGRGSQTISDADNDEVGGAGALKNQAHNVLFFWRDKQREMRIAELYQTAPQSAELRDLITKPSGKIHLTKQRGGNPLERGKLGSVSVYFKSGCGQFVESKDDHGTKYYENMKMIDDGLPDSQPF